MKVLHEAFFRSKNDRRVQHSEAFNPIPLEIIALVLTSVTRICFDVLHWQFTGQVEHCIKEWSTGTLVKAKFEESTALPWYDAHLEKLESWRELNSAVVDKIRATLYRRCRFNFGFLNAWLLVILISYPANLQAFCCLTIISRLWQTPLRKLPGRNWKAVLGKQRARGREMNWVVASFLGRWRRVPHGQAMSVS